LAARADRSVDARGEPEADGALVTVAGSTRAVRISARQARPRGRRQPPQAGDREGAVLVDQRDDVGDRCERDQSRCRASLSSPGPSSASASL